MSQHSVIPSRQRVETTKQINPRVWEQNTQTERFLIRNTKKNHRLKNEKRSSWTSRNQQIPTINLVKQKRPWKQFDGSSNATEVSNSSHNQELNKYLIPSIMKPSKSKRPECIRVPNYNSLIPLRRTVTFPHFPKICFSNVRSMVDKIDEIFASISTNLYDVVVITETWLNSRITDELIRIPGHSRGMNSRVTPLKFVCPRISHYACY